jgi:hypothetical protein
MLGRRALVTIAGALLLAAPAAARAPSCTDGITNGQESDVDCGGACEPCDIGDRCRRARDCTSGLCSLGECIERQYTPGEPVPIGYRVEVSEHDAAASVRKFGFVFLGLSYGGAYVAALSLPGELAWMQAPVLGPWLALDNADGKGLKALIIADGVLQAGGAALIIGGIVGRGHRLVRTSTPIVRLTPLTLPGGYGVSLGSVF